jgi:outer membrane protease
MKDSDWLTDNVDIVNVGATHPGKDIYSESDIDLSATIFDIHALYSLHPVSSFSIGPVGGFLYEHFHSDISNTSQIGYGPYNNPPNGSPSYTGVVLGKTLDYEVTYKIPYLGLHAEKRLGDSFQAGMEAGYSAWADAEDRDDHVLRSKLSTGTATGTAYRANLSARWDISDTDFFQLTGSYMKIRTTGTQHQYFYAGPFAGQSGDVDDKITSSQFSILLLYTQRI